MRGICGPGPGCYGLVVRSAVLVGSRGYLSCGDWEKDIDFFHSLIFV